MTNNNCNQKFDDEIRMLQSKVNILENNVSALSSQLGEERGCRCALQSIVKNYLTVHSKDFDNMIEWPTMETNI